MNIIYDGNCPHCLQPLLQHESEEITFEACLCCGFAFGRGVGADLNEEPEHYESQWFFVWELLFKTYGATSRRELAVKLRAAGLERKVPAPPYRKTIFDYELGHVVHILVAMRCHRRHQAPCHYCSSFQQSPLAAQILEDISRGRN